MSEAARTLVDLFHRLTPEERAEVMEQLECEEDQHWNARADRATAEGGEPVPAEQVRRTLERGGVL